MALAITLPLFALVLYPRTAGAQEAPVDLGTAESFAVLAGTTVTNTGPTIVQGDLGVSPGTAVVGFPPGTVIGGTIHAGDAVAAQAQSDLTAAYNDAAGRACDVILTGQDLGGLTLTPGVYCFSTSAQLTGTLTLDAQGDPNAVFIFQIGSTLITASGSDVVLINGAQACNVFWQVGSSATLGTNSTFQGNILALTSITANTGATVEGRLLARNGAVTLDRNTISRAECAPPPTTPPPTTPPTTTPPPTTPPPPGRAAITIVKDARPDGPQNFRFTGDLGSFVLDDDPNSVTARQRTFTVAPGSYIVTEPELGPGEERFDLREINCTAGSADAAVNLSGRSVVFDVEAGDVVTCTFVNVAVVPPPTTTPPPPPPGVAAITIAKDAVPDGPQNFLFGGDFGDFILDDDPESLIPRQRTFLVAPGSYTVIELELGPGADRFDLAEINCLGGDSTVDVAGRRVVIRAVAGDEITCVFVNRAPPIPLPPPGTGAITIVKDAIPDGPHNFRFDGDLGDFELDDDPASPRPRERTFNVAPGSYRIRELDPGGGFDLRFIRCPGGQIEVDLDAGTVVVTVAEGETVRCTFTNVAAEAPPPPPPGAGTITIVKDAVPNGPQDFRFGGDLGDFILDDDPTSETPGQRTFTVDPGTYTITEADLGRFVLTSIECTGGRTNVDVVDGRAVIVVEDGDEVACVFVNVADETLPRQPPGPPRPPDGDGPVGRPGRGPGGLAVTGFALGTLLMFGFVLLSAGGSLLYVGRHRAGRAGGRHRPGAARALAT